MSKIGKIKIIAVGKIKEKAIKELIFEFEKRLKPLCSLEIIELKDSTLENEATKFEKYISPHTILLDVMGTHYSSEQLSEKLVSLDECTFFIGSSNGFTPELKEKVREKISLSALTFTHEMARLFLVEQIYRANMIVLNKPYHK